MTVAEIRGKISSVGTSLSDRLEDLLTSDIFGSFRYLPPQKGLLQFLETAVTHDKKRFVPDVDVHGVNWSFWPYLSRKGYSSCEPDVVIGLADRSDKIHLVMIEAKYLSDKSSLEERSEFIGDQLARELDSLQFVEPADLGWDSRADIISKR